MGAPATASFLAVALLALAFPSRAQPVRLASAKVRAAPEAAPAPPAPLNSRKFMDLCVADPLARGALRQVRAQVEPATSDTFVQVDDRMIPLELAYPWPRNYVGFGSGGAPEALLLSGRTYSRTDVSVSAPAEGMAFSGRSGGVSAFRRRGAGGADRVYVPVGAGCAFQEYVPAAQADVLATAPNGGPRHRHIAYTTNRRATGQPQPESFYGTGLAAPAAGVLDVSLPFRHQLGRLERPRIYHSFGRSDSTAHVLLRQVNPHPDSTPGAPVLVYVHGFANTFHFAALRTAQLTEDLSFTGPVYLFSWPSRGSISPAAYDDDRLMASQSAAALAAFLEQVSAAHGEKQVNVVAHSMGTFALLNALQVLRRRHAVPMFNRVILASPDVEVKAFAGQYVSAASALSHQVTVYASNFDHVVGLSEMKNRDKRAGRRPDLLAHIKGIDVVDTSAEQFNPLGHDDFVASPAVLGDIFLLLRGRTPEQRNLVERQTAPDGHYWEFRSAWRR